MSNFLSELIFPVVFRPRRRIADFDAYLCIDETGSDDLELTEHPVQQGAAVIRCEEPLVRVDDETVGQFDAREA